MALGNNQNHNGNVGRRQQVTVSGIPPMVSQNFAETHPDFQPQTNFEGMPQMEGWNPQGKPMVSGDKPTIDGGVPMANGGVQTTQPMNFFGQGGGIHGKYDTMPNGYVSQPVIRGGSGVGANPSDYPYMQQYGGEQGRTDAGMVGYPMGGEQGAQPLARHPDGSVAAQRTPIQNGNPSVLGDPTDMRRNDIEALSQALANAGKQSRSSQFRADPSQRDGGFFGWLSGLLPKNRRGMRAGETPEEYDDRMTRNSNMYFALANAIRHFGNIINTSKGAPLQQFNDPSAMIEQGYQRRKAERQKQKALDADAAYKAADMELKQRAADADNVYKQMKLTLEQQAAERAANKDDFDRKYKTAGFQRMLDNDKFNQYMAGEKFKETKRHNSVAEGQGAARIALAQERNGIARARLANSIANGGGSGRGGSLSNLSSPAGHMNRKKDLNSIEKKQITQYLIKNGYINKDNLDAYNAYNVRGDTQSMNNLQNYWIAYAANMPGKKGDTFRTLLRDHYMYAETNTTSAKPAAKAQAKAQSKPKTQNGGKGKGKYSNLQ